MESLLIWVENSCFIGFIVRVLEPSSFKGIDKENEAAGDWNLMRKSQTTVHNSKAFGKVTDADVVMNLTPKRGNRQIADCKYPLEYINAILNKLTYL